MTDNSLKEITHKNILIRALSHEGRGICDINGKTVFVEGALPSECLDFRTVKRKKQYDEAVVTSIQKASTDRVIPKCAHFEICGGCSLQHMHPAAQIQWKQSVLLEQLQHFGKVRPKEVLPPILSESFGYRRKARLGVRYIEKKEKVLVGFREKKSHKLADISQCEILHPNIGLHLQALQTFILSLSVYKMIPQIEVAIGDKTTSLVLRHMRPLLEADKLKCVDFARHHNIQLYLQPEGPNTVELLWPEEPSLLSYYLSEFRIEFLFHPLDFVQINASINHQMVSLAIKLLDLKPTDQVLDLFCGLGNFTLPIAKFVHKVVGLEGSQEMVRRAFDNALHNGLTNVEFFEANLQEACQNMPWAENKYDKILLDPPRSGAFSLMGFLPQLLAKRIVYISCNPATLARDLGILIKEGYHLQSVGAMDMFPHTTHVESIALLIKD